MRIKPQLYLVLIFISSFLSGANCLQKTAEMNREITPANSAQVTTDTNISLPEEMKSSPTPSGKRGEDKLTGKFVCSPKQLRQGDVLTLTMNKPHGGYLEIITPTKEYIFISELDGYDLVEESKKAGANPFYGASEFAKLDELKINTAEATTVDAEKDKVNGKYQLEKIFSVSGEYKILLSKDSFETDDPTITGQCEVYYTNINQQQ